MHAVKAFSVYDEMRRDEFKFTSSMTWVLRMDVV